MGHKLLCGNDHSVNGLVIAHELMPAHTPDVGSLHRLAAAAAAGCRMCADTIRQSLIDDHPDLIAVLLAAGCDRHDALDMAAGRRPRFGALFPYDGPQYRAEIARIAPTLYATYDSATAAVLLLRWRLMCAGTAANSVTDYMADAVARTARTDREAVLTDAVAIGLAVLEPACQDDAVSELDWRAAAVAADCERLAANALQTVEGWKH